MDKFIKILIAALVSAVLILVSIAYSQEEVIDPLEFLDNKQEMMVYVNVKAREYGVSPELMKCLIDHENKAWNPVLQSGIIKKGIREMSFGLAQIHLPSHPKVSLEEAQDAKFSINFMAYEISQGRAWQWMTLKYCK